MSYSLRFRDVASFFVHGFMRNHSHNLKNESVHNIWLCWSSFSCFFFFTLEFCRLVVMIVIMHLKDAFEFTGRNFLNCIWKRVSFRGNTWCAEMKTYSFLMISCGTESYPSGSKKKSSYRSFRQRLLFFIQWEPYAFCCLMMSLNTFEKS